MHNKINRIGLDFQYCNSSNPYLQREPAIVVNRGDYWGNAKRYRVTPMRLAWVQAITSKSGFVADGGAGRAMWYHNIDSMYYGFKYESEFVSLEVLPDLRLKITLNDDGYEYIGTALTGIDSDEYSGAMCDLEYELLEDALCNGWTLDPNDNGSFFISYDASIDDNGDLDVSAGDLGWSYNFYAIRFYVETLLNKGYVIFDPYYFGELTLDDQRALSVTNFE